MILRVTTAEVTGPTCLSLTFNDGTRKAVDVAPLLEGPVFEPLREASYFAQATLDRVCGTVVWPNGADFAPEALHELEPLAQRHASAAVS
jgi:hypothetical protein